MGVSYSINTSKWWSIYAVIGRELWDRTKKPWKFASFLIYFLVSVVGFGGLGIWLELYEHVIPAPPDFLVSASAAVAVGLEVFVGGFSGPETDYTALRAAVLTFFPVIAGTAATQLLWTEDATALAKPLRSTAFALLSMFLVAALCVYPQRVPDLVAISIGVVASIGSLWMWVIANANQVALSDSAGADAASGGDPLRELPGSTTDFGAGESYDRF